MPKYGILTIELMTNIPGFKRPFTYNPSMTLKGAPKNSIIYFPTEIPITIKDLGGNQSGKHDKIKSFLSENRLNSIISSKKNKSKTGDASDQNIELIIKLLFTGDENLFLNETAYTILAKEEDMSSSPVRLIKEKPLQSGQTEKSFVKNQEKIEMHNYMVKLTLYKGGKLSSAVKGCEKQKLVIKEKMNEIKTTFDKPGKPDDDNTDKKLDKQQEKKRKKINIPSGYINPEDWRKISRDQIFSRRDYYINLKTEKTQYELPIPFKFRKEINEWSGEEGNKPPPPTSTVPPAQPTAPLPEPTAPLPEPTAPPAEQPKKVSFAPSGGKKTRRSRGLKRNNRTLKASSSKISQALHKKKRDGGNISVFFASETPKNYFTEREIASLR